MSDSEQIHETTTEARGGTGPGVMRYVLGASLLLAVIAMTVIVGTGWLSR